MKSLLFSFLLLFNHSCKQNSPSQKAKENHSVYLETFFTVDKELYFSDGRRFYCGFKNWEHFYNLRGTKKQPAEIIEYKELPSGMKFIKECNLGIVTKNFFE